MKFKFSLDPVLKVRKHQEKMQKQKLAEEVSRQQQINELCEEVEGKLNNYLKHSDEKEAKSLHEIRRHTSHLEMVHQRMVNLTQELDKASDKVRAEREKLADAHKKLHIMEKVRDFEHTLFSERMSKEEQKFLDEIATQSFSK
jgi:flagellar export protein FliJ